MALVLTQARELRVQRQGASLRGQELPDDVTDRVHPPNTQLLSPMRNRTDCKCVFLEQKGSGVSMGTWPFTCRHSQCRAL